MSFDSQPTTPTPSYFHSFTSASSHETPIGREPSGKAAGSPSPPTHPIPVPNQTPNTTQKQQPCQAASSPRESPASLAKEPASNDNLLSVGFNQDYGFFSTRTDNGFRIYNCDPFKETFRPDFNTGGIGLVEMLFRCNILAVVGGGSTPRYPPNMVMIWDDHQSRCIGGFRFGRKFAHYDFDVTELSLSWSIKFIDYSFIDLKLLHQIETIANPKGLCSVSPAVSPSVLACPGLHRGQVRVEHYSIKKTKFISAHDSNLACFALTSDGRLLATTSTKGTLIRVFNTLDGTRLQELRRGADRAEIYSLTFSKGTVHVFSLGATSGSEDIRGGEPPQTLASMSPSGCSRNEDEREWKCGC